MKQVTLIATTAFGLEAVVARELTALGYYRQQVENGRVQFQGDLNAIARTNLWLRSAERVLLLVGEFEARTFDELFDQTKALPWQDWLPVNAEFPVAGKSIKSQLHSVPNCQAIVKKAVVEALKEDYQQEWFSEDGPRYQLEVALLKDRVSLTIDTSGVGLHKRGYRQQAGEAPIKETLAAALVQLSYWSWGRLLLDPFCGSGTILIEAAMLGDNIAPGLTRRFAAEDWPLIDPSIWQAARSEASAKIKDTPMQIQGYDIDNRVLEAARNNADNAGVGEKIHFQRRALADVSSPQKYGCVISNPPYGERLEDRPRVESLYQELGKIFRPWETWSLYFISAHDDFERLFGRRAGRKRKLYNGRIKCTFFQYPGPPPPRQRETVKEAEDET